MQKVYIKKTPFGTFRSDKPLSHGITVFLILQSIAYFNLAALALCGLLYRSTDPEIIQDLLNSRSISALGYALEDALELIGVNTLTFYLVALGFFTALGVLGIVVVYLRTVAFDRFRQEVVCVARADESRDATYTLTPEDGDAILSLALGADQTADASHDGDPMLNQEQNNQDALNLYGYVGMNKRAEMLKYAARMAKEQGSRATDAAEREKLILQADKYHAHYLKNRSIRTIKGDAQDLARALHCQVSYGDTVENGHRRFTVQIPETILTREDGTQAVVDGFFRIVVRRNHETLASLVCVLPLNGTESPCEFSGYYPTDTLDTPEMICEPMELWLMEKP